MTDFLTRLRALQERTKSPDHQISISADVEIRDFLWFKRREIERLHEAGGPEDVCRAFDLADATKALADVLAALDAIHAEIP